MTEAERDAYEERASILEFDAHLPRDEAERQAKAMILKTEDRKPDPPAVKQTGLWT
jgi:hypothetical protein